MTAPANNIIDEKDALRVVAQMTIGEIVRGIAALSKSAPVAESPETTASEAERDVLTAVRRWKLSVDSHAMVYLLTPESLALYESAERLCGPVSSPCRAPEKACIGKGETQEWPKLVGQRNWEPSFACWVFQSSNKGNWWVDGQVGECIYSLDSLLEDKRMVVLDTPEARAFIAKRYDEQGNLRAEYRKGETGKVRVFTAGPAAMVWRSGLDGDYLINDRFNANATGSVGTCVQNGWDELPPAEVPQWLSDHGYAIDGTRKQETPATPIDPDAGKKYGEAVKQANAARHIFEAHLKQYRDCKACHVNKYCATHGNQLLSSCVTFHEIIGKFLSLDAAQGGVR